MYFVDLINAISTASECLPRSRPGISKDYWSDDLSSKKRASCDAYRVWCENGKPSSGPIFELKKKAFSTYKLSIRRAKNNFAQARVDEMHESLSDRNTTKFWKQWQNLHGKQKCSSQRINGKIDDKEIANNFAASFKKIYTEARSEQDTHLSNKFGTQFSEYFRHHHGDDISSQFLSWDDMLQIMSKLQPGKSAATVASWFLTTYG